MATGDIGTGSDGPEDASGASGSGDTPLGP